MPKRRFLRLDERQRAKLKDRIKAGDSVSALAKEFGVSRRTVYNYKLGVAESELYYRSAVLTVRLNKADFEALDDLAKAQGLSRAETARRVLLRAVDVFIQPEETSQAILDLTKQLIPIGRNVNQIAEAMNRASKMGTLRLDKETQAALSRIRSRVDAVTEMAEEARHVMVARVRLQRARNAEIFEALGAPEAATEALGAPEAATEALGAPEAATEALGAPERPPEATGTPERPPEATGTPKRANTMADLRARLLGGKKGRKGKSQGDLFG